VIRVGQHDEDRFDRMRRVPWVDMDGISSSRVLVVGAGALGNEAVKNLVLAGFRDVTVLDMDHVVASNLSRCVFFRDSDVGGGMKTEIVAARASELDPSARIKPLVGRVQDLEDWDYDVALGCLDNVAARLHLNSHAYFHGVPYVDGATDGFRGKVQTVLPGGPCLQCVMNRSHARIAEVRFSCTGNKTGFVPKMAADITTTAVVAAIQAREAIKIASGKAEMCIKHVTYYNGENNESFTLEARIGKDCVNHG